MRKHRLIGTVCAAYKNDTNVTIRNYVKSSMAKVKDFPKYIPINKSKTLSYPEYKSTTNVSLIFFEGTIKLPALLDSAGSKIAENMIIEKSKMNGLGEHNYCVAVRLPINEDITATLKVYAAKIEVWLPKKLHHRMDNLQSIISNKLDELGVKYRCRLEKFLDFTLFSFGTVNTMYEIEQAITSVLPNTKEDTKDRTVLFKPAFIHVTGLKNPNSFELVQQKFLQIFNSTNIAPNLRPSAICSIMSNGTYKIGKSLNIWNVANLITTAPGFSDGRSFSIYDNLQSPHMVIVVLSVETTHDERQRIWREDNIETVFVIKRTGSVTQSNPSHEIGLRSFGMFLRAIEYLGDKVLR